MTGQWELARLEEIEEGCARGFDLDCGQPHPLRLIAVRRSGEFFVYENRCPHRGTPLDWSPDRFLDRSGEHLICATHGALFRIEDGECLLGPCVGEALRTVPVVLSEGRLHVVLPLRNAPETSL